ncbi:MAG: RidA family protein [Bacteroidetes bacterium]|nr:RidA family protein [Bacteroidota bacterium]
MDRKNISSGGKWENIVGYSRAVRAGNMIFIAGTTAHSDNSIVGINDPYTQSIYILKKIEAAIIEAGGQLKNVVCTRMFVTDISNWEEIGRAHGEFFKDIKPVATMVQVSSLIDPGLLVEIEAIAVVQ